MSWIWNRGSYIKILFNNVTGPVVVPKRSCPTRDDLQDWNFTCSVPCPPMNISIMTPTRQMMVIVCDGAEFRFDYRVTANMSEVYRIPFQHPCLASVIKTSCQDGLAVPNIVHFVWFANETKVFRFYYFLSFMSAHNIQKPCVILVHSNVLPAGPYWDYMLQLVPNIVHVYREPPTSIFGKKVGPIEHAADLARIEAVRGAYLFIFYRQEFFYTRQGNPWQNPRHFRVTNC
jgi:hypothetical protein